MLVQEKPLPGTECQVPPGERHSQIGCGQNRANVCRHVIGPLSVVFETRITVSNQVRNKSLDVAQYARIRILADDQTSARVSTEDVTQAGVDAGFCDDRCDLPGDFVDAAAVCRNLELFLEHARFPLG